MGSNLNRRRRFPAAVLLAFIAVMTFWMLGQADVAGPESRLGIVPVAEAASSVFPMPGSVMSGPAMPGPAMPGSNALKDVLNRAKTAEADGDLGLAELLYRKVLFVNPKYSKGRSRIKKIRRLRAEEMLSEAKGIDPEYTSARATILRRAHALDPKNKAISGLLKGLGYVLDGDVYRRPEEIKVRATSDEEMAEARRKELRLRPDFQMIRRGPFRFFTNVNLRDAKAVIQQMINANLTHYSRYRALMKPFDLHEPQEGIDLVLFDQQQQYLRYTKISGTAGVYIPSLRAGFFFRDGGYNFSTMLHEMTHQLNDKMLHARNHAWFEEGIAEYFGAGSLSQGGKRIKLGIPDVSRMTAFGALVRSRGGGGYIPLAEFVLHTRAQITSEFYAEAWALTFYLMEHHPLGRLIIFDYVSATNGLAAGVGSKGVTTDLSKIVERYGISFSDFEEGFLAHYRGGA